MMVVGCRGSKALLTQQGPELQTGDATCRHCTLCLSSRCNYYSSPPQIRQPGTAESLGRRGDPAGIERSWRVSLLFCHKRNVTFRFAVGWYLAAAPQHGAITAAAAPESQRESERLIAMSKQRVGIQRWMQRSRTDSLYKTATKDWKWSRVWSPISFFSGRVLDSELSLCINFWSVDIIWWQSPFWLKANLHMFFLMTQNAVKSNL